jgi:hypothetical protein
VKGAGKQPLYGSIPTKRGVYSYQKGRVFLPKPNNQQTSTNYDLDWMTEILRKWTIIQLVERKNPFIMVWSPGRDLNPRPTAYKAAALASELPGRTQKNGPTPHIYYSTAPTANILHA